MFKTNMHFVYLSCIAALTVCLGYYYFEANVNGQLKSIYYWAYDTMRLTANGNRDLYYACHNLGKPI